MDVTCSFACGNSSGKRQRGGLAILQLAFLSVATLLSGCATSKVVNLSHYDYQTPDFAQMRAEGILGVIHEATYPPGATDPQYGPRQDAAFRAGMLWGAYHFGNGS